MYSGKSSDVNELFRQVSNGPTSDSKQSPTCNQQQPVLLMDTGKIACSTPNPAPALSRGQSVSNNDFGNRSPQNVPCFPNTNNQGDNSRSEHCNNNKKLKPTLRDWESIVNAESTVHGYSIGHTFVDPATSIPDDGMRAYLPDDVLNWIAARRLPDDEQHQQQHHCSQDVLKHDRNRAYKSATTQLLANCQAQSGGLDVEHCLHKKAKNMPLASTAKLILLEWYESHVDFPYPNSHDLKSLANKSDTTVAQVENFFRNERYKRGYNKKNPHIRVRGKKRSRDSSTQVENKSCEPSAENN